MIWARGSPDISVTHVSLPLKANGILSTMVLVDFTKVGTISTSALNKHCTLAAKIVSRNPLGYLNRSSNVFYLIPTCFQTSLVFTFFASVSKGSCAIIIAPLLFGTAGGPGSSLRKDHRLGSGNIDQEYTVMSYMHQTLE